MSELHLIRHLTQIGMLKNWHQPKEKCPYCKKGSVGPLRRRPPKRGPTRARGTLQYKCNNKSCKHFIPPHHHHPIFRTGSGKSYVPLKTQVEILYCHVLSLKHIQITRLLGVDSQFVQKISVRIDKCRMKYVVNKQRSIKFGCSDSSQYMDVEADEIDLGKEAFEDSDGSWLKWEQWAGVVQRGYPQTLYMFRTKSR